MKNEELYALLRRRGVLWPSAEIYGGTQGLYDYGPLGFALKRRVEEAWAAWFVGLSHDYHLIEPAEILPEAVVRASGHLENFTDPEVTCESCHSIFRAETVLEKVRPEGVDGLTPAQIGEILSSNHVKCPTCASLALSVPRPFNLMFGLDWGVTGKERAYLRPETAQGSYLSFSRMWDVGRRALPLGIAVIGKAYRNEIAPRQVLFRMRAFTQAELQIFFDPAGFSVPFDRVRDELLPVLRVDRRERGEEAPELVRAGDLVASGGLPEFYVYHLVHTVRFFRDVLGYPADRIRLFEKSDKERAFYNRIQFDVEVRLESLSGVQGARRRSLSGRLRPLPPQPGFREGPLGPPHGAGTAAPPRPRVDVRRRSEHLGAFGPPSRHGGGADALEVAELPRPRCGRGLSPHREGARSLRAGARGRARSARDPRPGPMRGARSASGTPGWTRRVLRSASPWMGRPSPRGRRRTRSRCDSATPARRSASPGPTSPPVSCRPFGPPARPARRGRPPFPRRDNGYIARLGV